MAKASTAAGAKRSMIVVAGFVVVALAAWLAWRAFGPAPSMPALASATPAQVDAGAAVYARHCAACHGANLEGEPNWRQRKPSGRLPAPPHDDSGHTWHHADEALFQITKHGLKPPIAPDGYQSDMPGYAGVLTDEQIWSALAFIASRWSARERAHQARVTAAQQAAR